MQRIKEKYDYRLSDIQYFLHQNPEIAFSEYRTTELICDTLKEIGCEIIDLGLSTGVVARINTGKSGKVIALRADIDGIQQREAVERPDKSVNIGVMHACGHDVHITSLLGAAMDLMDIKDELTGDVVFIFQPAEETIAGAKHLIAKGLFDKVHIDAMFGLHNDPDMECGKVGVKTGPLMAAKDDFCITVHGTGGHGGLPHLCIDPVLAGCSIVSSLQSVVSRNVNPEEAAVVSVCSVHGGEASNLIPNEMSLGGCARTFKNSVQELVIRRIREIAEGIAAGYGCEINMDHYATVPPLINEGQICNIAAQAAANTVGANNVICPSVNFASEDFSVYGKYLPTFFYFLGSGIPERKNAPWHSSYFMADPETALWGAALLRNSVIAAQKDLN